MIDHIRPSERLARLSPVRWQTKLALLLIAVALVIALMCDAHATEAQLYTLVLCPTGNSIAMRHDKRDRNGVIVKSKWERTCLAPLRVHFSKLM